MGFECSICNETQRERIDENDCCALSPCGHVFHKVCIVKWKEQSRICPICRSTIKSNLTLFGLTTMEDEEQGNEIRRLTEIETNHKTLLMIHDKTVKDLNVEEKRGDALEKNVQRLKFKLSMYEEMFGQECSLQFEKLILDAETA